MVVEAARRPPRIRVRFAGSTCHPEFMPRLSGRTLLAAVRASRTQAGVAALRTIAFRQYRMDQLMGLSSEMLDPILHEPRPIQGAGPRQWGDQRLETDPRSGGHARLAAAFRDGSLRPSELLSDLTVRIDKKEFGEATFSPFIARNPDAAVLAEQADARLEAGKPLGPLDGVPVPVKDEVDIAGLPTFGGTAFLSDPASENAWVVERLLAAGAVVYAKTHTTEWGMSPLGINPNHSMPRNVHSADRAPGGSSTGTGAAVALGLAAVGLGSDGGGSIRIPAAMQGVFGIKPTFQRIGRSGDIFGKGSVGTLGPIGQTVSDLVEFLCATGTRPDPGDPSTAYAPDSDPTAAWRLALGRGIRGARIGIPHREWDACEPRIAEACYAALRQLEADGAKLVDVELPHAQVAQAIGVLCIGPETAAHVVDYEGEFRSLFGAELQLQLAILGSVGASEYLRAQRARAALRRTTGETMRTVDLIALPTLPVLPPHYPVREDRRPVADDDGTRNVCRYTFLANLTGLPAGTAPVGVVDGLPVGLQLIGDAWDEASVLAGLAQLERSSQPVRPRDYYNPLG